MKFDLLFIFTHWVIVVGLSARVFWRKLPVGFSLAWLAFIFSVPFAGAFLYLFLGEKRLGRNRLRNVNAITGDWKDWQNRLREDHRFSHSSSEKTSKFLRKHARNVVGIPAQSGNRLTMFEDFSPLIDQLIKDIDRARGAIGMGFYIWEDSGRGEKIIDALVRAAQRGVEVRVLADAVGSKAFLKSEACIKMQSCGIDLKPVLPLRKFGAFFVRTDLRYHRKIVVIDDEIAYTGSQNMADPRFFMKKAGIGQWVDAMVRVEGPAANTLGGIFLYDWAVEAGSHFAAPEPYPCDDRSDPGEAFVQVVATGPDMSPQAIHQLLLIAIYSADQSLVLTTPYFVPDDSILTAILSAALRGVKVTLIVPDKNDSRLVRYASASHYDDLLEAGVAIYKYKGGLLHTKSLLIDDHVSIIGSVNLDMRSFWLNFEASLFVYDDDFSAVLKKLQDSYIENSEWLELERWQTRPFWHRFQENAIRLLSPLL